MSFHLFFLFTQGLSRPMQVPVGTLERILERIEDTETCLGITRSTYKDNPPHWQIPGDFGGATDEEICETAEAHNEFVRDLYRDFSAWSENPPSPSEMITPEQAREFWCGLRLITVEPERWTEEYYRSRMESIYETMRRGESDEGQVFDADPLTAKQANAVIALFSEHLDTHDIRLLVPKGHDHLASSHDGGYHWCEKCGEGITEDDAYECAGNCKDCPLREIFHEDEFDDES